MVVAYGVMIRRKNTDYERPQTKQRGLDDAIHIRITSTRSLSHAVIGEGLMARKDPKTSSRAAAKARGLGLTPAISSAPNSTVDWVFPGTPKPSVRDMPSPCLPGVVGRFRGDPALALPSPKTILGSCQPLGFAQSR